MQTVFPVFYLLLIYVQTHEYELYEKIKKKELNLNALLKEIEDIFPSYLGDADEIRPFINASVLFLKLYENYINYQNPIKRLFVCAIVVFW